MMRKLCNFMFPNHIPCENKIHTFMVDKARDDNKIYSLKQEITQLLGQIQELKAINNYQAWELEKNIAELEEKLKLCICRKDNDD